MTIKKYKYRNPVQRELQEERKFKIKVHNDKKKTPPEPLSIKEALKEMIEDEDIDEDSDKCPYCGFHSGDRSCCSDE